MAYSRPAWHDSSEVNTAVSDFYHRHAKQPDSSEAKQKLRSYLDTIRSHLNAQGVPCQRFEFVGSTYEGLKVDDGLEFDIFVILDDRVFEVHSTHLPDYKRLTPKPNVQREYFRHALDNGYVSAEKMVRKFQSYMDTLRNSFPEMRRGEVVLRKHGPAIQMDVYHPYGGGFCFSIDLVPTIAIFGNYYVAKPHKDMKEAWLHSFSVEMKQKLERIDQDNGRRKQVLRTLKALCRKESSLANLSSHHLKMLLFSDLDENPWKTWRPDQLAIRLLDLMKRLQRYLDSGHYPHYYLPRINMIERLGSSNCENMARRLENLYNNELSFFGVLSATRRLERSDHWGRRFGLSDVNEAASMRAINAREAFWTVNTRHADTCSNLRDCLEEIGVLPCACFAGVLVLVFVFCRPGL